MTPTPQQAKVLSMRISGFSYREIALKFGIREKTISVHLKNACVRMGFTTVREMITAILANPSLTDRPAESPSAGTCTPAAPGESPAASFPERSACRK